MASLLPRRAPYVCKACQSAQSSRAVLRAFATSTGRSASLREQLRERSEGKISKSSSGPTQRIEDEANRTFQRAQQAKTHPSTSRPGIPRAQARAPSPSIHDVPDSRQALRSIQEEALSILESETVPDEAAVLDLLARAQLLANVLTSTQQAYAGAPAPTSQEETKIPAKQISRPDLFEDLSETPKAQTPASTATTTNTNANTDPQARQLAKALYTLLEDPKLYISEPILTSYVHTLTTLSLPQYLPKIFHLYAHKPIPKPGSHPIQYREPWSRAPKYAVPKPLVETAIESAIRARDMPLCISIIDTTVNTPAWFAAKFVRRAAIPLTLAGSVVPLSYSLSNRAAEYQLSWDPDTFFWMCIAGSTAYLGTMGALLFVTVTTWNDHHKRVRWVPGTPLARRWFREEERALFDRVAQGWGFEDETRHGEEGGEEWEGLREELGGRWLELDRSSLLPGML